MKKPNGQLYKVRTADHRENIIHAPEIASGWYSLVVGEDGSFHYYPVKE